MADNFCKNFIVEVVDEIWYKELEDPDTFYTNAMALTFLEHHTEFFSGLHTVDVVDILQVMKKLSATPMGYHSS